VERRRHQARPDRYGYLPTPGPEPVTAALRARGREWTGGEDQERAGVEARSASLPAVHRRLP